MKVDSGPTIRSTPHSTPPVIPIRRRSGGQNTGIPVFPDIEIGIDATATTLLSGHAYVRILWVLAEGNGLVRVLRPRP